MHRYFPILIHFYLPKIQHICFLVTYSSFLTIRLLAEEIRNLLNRIPV